ncbi:MAG: ATP-binding protein [Vicinamibacterales bacterium]
MTFGSVVGHARVTGLLAQAISRETLPPTVLFTGPAGVGKWRVAQAVAAVANCLEPVRDRAGLAVDACGVCRSCDRIERGVHVDVMAIEPDEKASIKIDVVRDLIDRIGFRPFEGRRRFVLIREADTLEPSAQNSLLKSLEEPPPATVFILTTAVPGVLLSTVRSRCMRLAFARLTEAEVADLLARDGEMDPREARALAALADGSVGQALALGNTDMAVLRETALLVLQEAARNAGAQGRLQAAAALVTGTAKKERPRDDIGLVLRLLASMLRDLEVLNAGGDARLLANPAMAEDLDPLRRAYSGERTREAFAAVDRALFALERNAGTKVVAEWLAMQL